MLDAAEFRPEHGRENKLNKETKGSGNKTSRSARITANAEKYLGLICNENRRSNFESAVVAIRRNTGKDENFSDFCA